MITDFRTSAALGTQTRLVLVGQQAVSGWQVCSTTNRSLGALPNWLTTQKHVTLGLFLAPMTSYVDLKDVFSICM